MPRPPIGLLPEKIWKIYRMEDLKVAIQRYYDNDMEIPFKWQDEYMKLEKEVKEMDRL